MIVLGPRQCARPNALTRQRRVASRVPLRAKRQSMEEALTERQMNTARMRGEAETPFRSIRLLLCGFGAVSAGIGFVVSIPQLTGALMNPQSVLSVDEVVRNIGIDLGAAGACAFLFNQDWKAGQKQLARLAREEALAGLSVELASGKLVPLGALRGFARVVICAGNPQQLKAALEGAEPYKEQLLAAGVLFVPVPIYEGDGESLPAPGPEDLRWRASPARLEQWSNWFGQQLELATSATSQSGLYLGLRLDGRVRASGMGLPPWPRFAAELAPLEARLHGMRAAHGGPLLDFLVSVPAQGSAAPDGDGAWSGFMDGFDGEVKVFNG